MENRQRTTGNDAAHRQRQRAQAEGVEPVFHRSCLPRHFRGVVLSIT